MKPDNIFLLRKMDKQILQDKKDVKCGAHITTADFMILICNHSRYCSGFNKNGYYF